MSVEIPVYWERSPETIRIMSLIDDQSIYCEFLDAETKKYAGHCIYTLDDNWWKAKLDSRLADSSFTVVNHVFNKILHRTYQQLIIENEIFGLRSNK